MPDLDALYDAAAERCEADGVPIDGTVNGPVCQWVRKNCRYRPDTEFFIVAGITAAMADRDARREGFANQCERAASRVNWKPTNPLLRGVR